MELCFIACPIGEPNSSERNRSDQLLKYVLSPVLEKAGYKAVRADQMSNPGLITTQIVKALDSAALVIADLTGANANVFYELALRHATGKPYIQLIATGEKIPFDVRGLRTIDVDLHDLDSVEHAKKEIAAQISTIKRGVPVDSPVMHAMTENMFTKDSNLVQVFFEKFWAIEEHLERLPGTLKLNLSETAEYLEDRVDSLVDRAAEDIVGRITSELKKDD